VQVIKQTFEEEPEEPTQEEPEEAAQQEQQESQTPQQQEQHEPQTPQPPENQTTDGQTDAKTYINEDNLLETSSLWLWILKNTGVLIVAFLILICYSAIRKRHHR